MKKYQRKEKKSLCSYRPLFYWPVMSICTPACWCLSIHTCAYWVLQQEILRAEFNRAESILRENSHPLLDISNTTSQRCWPVCFCCTPRPTFGCEPHSSAFFFFFFSPGTPLNSERRRQLKAIVSHGVAANCESKFWEGPPVVLPLHRETGGSQQRYRFTSQPWACCHRQYISLYLIHC